MSEKILDKEREHTLELLVFMGSKTEEALRHIPWKTFFMVDQFPSEKKIFQRDRARHWIGKVSRSYQNESMYEKQARAESCFK